MNPTTPDEMPRLFVEPPIPVSTEFVDVDHVRGVIGQLDAGNFRVPALLVERMMMNPRLRAVLDTRLAGLISTEIRFEPSQNNRDARRAAREFAEDWPLMAPAPMRKQMMKWGLMLGLGLAQRPGGMSPRSGRHILKLRPYWPGFAYWYWSYKAYRIQTFNRGVVQADSPSVEPEERAELTYNYATAPSPYIDGPRNAADSPWIIAEPFGVNSYREAIVHAAWRPWLGHDWAMRDQARASEKHGLGIIKVIMPRGTGEEWRDANARFIRALQGDMGSEGAIPCEVRDDGQKQDVEPFEFNGSGFQAIADNMNACAVAMAILFLGHNLTTEIKGGSYAAAGVAEYIRDDKKTDDAESEWAYLGPQLAQEWARLNYGDPGLAPIANYTTDSPAVNKTAADTINALSMALGVLGTHGVDTRALCERFRLPMVVEQKAMVPVGGPAVAGKKLDITPTDRATYVKVDEARSADGLAPVGGDVGAMWIAEHSATIRAEIAPDVATAAAAEAGTQPGADSPEGPIHEQNEAPAKETGEMPDDDQPEGDSSDTETETA